MDRRRETGRLREVIIKTGRNDFVLEGPPLPLPLTKRDFRLALRPRFPKQKNTPVDTADADLVTIQDLPGHSRIKTTQRYCKVSNLKVQRDYYKAMEMVMERELKTLKKQDIKTLHNLPISLHKTDFVTYRLSERVLFTARIYQGYHLYT